MAAGQAAIHGASVTILEKKSRCGRKLRITGKGRCNLSNDSSLPEFINQFGRNGKFLHQAFSKFFNQDLVKFFEKQGVPTNIERGQRIFPKSELAEDVVDALIKWVLKKNVKIIPNSQCTSLLVEDNIIKGVKTKDRSYPADKVILCAGGASYPATGSTGDGYKILQNFGHKIVPIRPALVPIETSGDTAQRLQGLSLKNVSLKLLIDNKKKNEIFGEMLFTHFGLSGPIILTISRQIVDALSENKTVTLSFDLKSALDNKKLENRLLNEFKENNRQQFKSILKNLLPNKLIQICIDQTKIAGDKIAHQITSEERKRLRLWFKDFRFEVTGFRSFNEAIITAGGVNLKEINPRTMESKIIKNLFIAGEILDLDGNTGGYNLQAAFSTGYLAGISAAD